MSFHVTCCSHWYIILAQYSLVIYARIGPAASHGDTGVKTAGALFLRALPHCKPVSCVYLCICSSFYFIVLECVVMCNLLIAEVHVHGTCQYRYMKTDEYTSISDFISSLSQAGRDNCGTKERKHSKKTGLGLRRCKTKREERMLPPPAMHGNGSAQSVQVPSSDLS